MNINHLETFVSVVKFKSIHKAADILFLAQPTVSARIKTLEKELNTILFARSGRGLLLTEQGREFLPYAEQIIQMVEEGKKQMKERDDQKLIVIGADPVTSQYFIPFALPLWKRSNPRLRFKFVSEANEVLIEKVLRNKIDVAFINDMASSEIKKQQILDNPFKLVARSNHPLQSEKKVTIHRLGEEPMLLYDAIDSELNHLRKLFEVEKVEPRIEFQGNHLEVSKSIIKEGHAIGFLPYLCVKEELRNGSLIEIDITHLIQIKSHVFLSYVNPEVSKWGLLEGIEESVKLFNLK